MSDNFRQSFGDKMESTMKPDSEKSTMERAGDKMKGGADSMASSAQPDSQKSYMQQGMDMMSGNSNENSQSMMGKAKNMMGMNDNNVD